MAIKKESVGDKSYNVRTFSFSKASIKAFEDKYKEIKTLAGKQGAKRPPKAALASALFMAAAKMKAEDLIN